VRDRNLLLAAPFVLALAVLVLASSPALAYVGPGAGLEFVGYFSSLVALLVTAFSTMLLWPFYALLRWFREHRTDAGPGLSGSSPILPASESGVIGK
jgi:hypothetical protein